MVQSADNALILDANQLELGIPEAIRYSQLIPTDRQLGDGLKKAREKHCRDRRHVLAGKMGEGDWILRDRESGRVPLRVADILQYAKAMGVDPVAVFSDVLNQCCMTHWEKIADRLGCTIPMAKQRLETAEKQHQLSQGQVWAMYLQEQIRL